MNTYRATNTTDDTTYTIQAHTIQDALTWVQNYADLSKEPWTVEEIKTPKTIIAYFTYDDIRQSRDVTHWTLEMLQDLHATATNIKFIYS